MRQWAALAIWGCVVYCGLIALVSSQEVVGQMSNKSIRKRLVELGASKSPDATALTVLGKGPTRTMEVLDQMKNLKDTFGLGDPSCGIAASKIDLTPLMSDEYSLNDTVNKYLYTVQLCGLSKDTFCATHAPNPGSICQFKYPKVFYHVLSGFTTPAPVWQPYNNDPKLGVTVTLANGDTCGFSGPRTVTINMICTPSVDPGKTFTVIQPNDCSYDIQFPTAVACPGYQPQNQGGGGGKSGLSGGTIFLILLIVLIPVYIVAGFVYKMKMKGTTGIESCPNIEFWRLLPVLIKDGFLFTWSKLRGLCNKGQSDYQEVK